VDGELDAAEKADFDATCSAAPAARAPPAPPGAQAGRPPHLLGIARAGPAAHHHLGRLHEERLPLGPALLQRLGALQPRTVALAAGLAGVLTWFAAGGLTRPVLGASPAQRALDERVAQHARTLPLDFAASDSGAVQRWLQTRLDYSVRLPASPRSRE